MTKREKLLEAMRRAPQDDWRIDDVAALCRTFGLRYPAPSGGSHFGVSHPALADILTVPARRPIKPIYIRKRVDMVDHARLQTSEDDA